MPTTIYIKTNNIFFFLLKCSFVGSFMMFVSDFIKIIGNSSISNIVKIGIRNIIFSIQKMIRENYFEYSIKSLDSNIMNGNNRHTDIFRGGA
jgi:hypothetical protein